MFNKYILKADAVRKAVSIYAGELGVKANVSINEVGVCVKVYSVNQKLALTMRNALAAYLAELTMDEVGGDRARQLFTMSSLADAKATVKAKMLDEGGRGFIWMNRSILNARFVAGVKVI